MTNNPEYLNIKLLRATSKPPVKAYLHDAGFDVFSDEPDFIIGRQERKKIRLGFAMEIAPDWCALIQEKSGMAVNHGILTIGNVIDCNYRGECHAVILCTDLSVVIKHGQKVAQMLIIPCYTGQTIRIVTKLSETFRRDKGFGSSGKE